MKRLLTLLLVVAAVGLAMAPAVSAAPQAGAISGGVVDAHGNAVAGALVVVELRTQNGRKFHARTHTDRHGRFEFARVPAGRGVIGAEKQGVGRGRARVAVRPGGTTRVRIQLR